MWGFGGAGAPAGKWSGSSRWKMQVFQNPRCSLARDCLSFGSFNRKCGAMQVPLLMETIRRTERRRGGEKGEEGERMESRKRRQRDRRRDRERKREARGKGTAGGARGESSLLLICFCYLTALIDPVIISCNTVMGPMIPFFPGDCRPRTPRLGGRGFWGAHFGVLFFDFLICFLGVYKLWEVPHLFKCKIL